MSKYPHDVLGNKPDDAVETVSLTATVVAYVKGILGVTGTRADAADDTAGTSSIVALLRFMLNRVNNIFGLVNSMLRLMGTEGTVTLDGTEQVLWVVDAPQGLFKPMAFQVNFTNQTAAEVVIVRVYYRITAGAGLILASATAFAAAQDPPLKPINFLPNRFGIKVTIERTAGGALTYPFAVFYGRGT